MSDLATGQTSSYSQWLRDWATLRNNPADARYPALVRLLHQPMVSAAVRLRERVPSLSDIPEAATLTVAEALERAASGAVGTPRRGRSANRTVRLLAIALVTMAVFLVWSLSRQQPVHLSANGAQDSHIDPSQLAAARSVLSNAADICTLREEAPHLVVECHSDISVDQRLPFAQSIANADAIVSGQSRNIYFYLPSGSQFAQADPLRGVRLKE